MVHLVLGQLVRSPAWPLHQPTHEGPNPLGNPEWPHLLAEDA